MNPSKFISQMEDSKLWALKNVAFSIKKGECFGIIGPNGSGKSTLLRVLSRIYRPDEGAVRIGGRVATLIALGAGFQNDFTGRENVFLNGSILGFTRNQIETIYDDIVEFAELEDFMDTPVKYYSSGMRARLGFSIAVNVRPDVLLVDEVLSVGDASFNKKCDDKIEEFKHDGITIVLVTHSLEKAADLCDRLMWLREGEVASIGAVEKVLDDYARYVSEIKDESLKKQMPKSPMQEERFGSGEIVVKDFKVFNSEGKENYVHDTGGDIKLVIYYHATKPIENPVFAVQFSTLDGKYVCGTNTLSHPLDTETVEGEGTATFSITNIPLLEGTYLLTPCIVNYNVSPHTTYDYRQNFGKIMLNEKYRWKFGTTDLRGFWETEPRS